MKTGMSVGRGDYDPDVVYEKRTCLQEKKEERNGHF